MKTKLIMALISASAFAATNANADVKVSIIGGLKVSSGDYTVQFGGRIQYDFNRSKGNGVVDENTSKLRRGRLYAKGNFAKDWSFQTQFNTNGDGVEDLYLRYTGFGKGANITVGNQKMPFSLEELQSSKDISVLERSAITELYSIGRAEGVQLQVTLGTTQRTRSVYLQMTKKTPKPVLQRVIRERSKEKIA